MTQKAGKGQPPAEHQFKPGESGNKKGRPKKVKKITEETAISKVASTTFQNHKNGEVRELSAKELAERSIFNAALSGKKVAQRKVMSWIKKRHDLNSREQLKKQLAVGKYQIEAVDPRNTDNALKLLNIISVNEERSDREFIQFELQPDAVLAAFKRSRGGIRMSKDDLDWMLAYTKDGESLDLPKRFRS